MASLFDSHCHLDSKEFSANPGAVLERARAAGVEFLVNIQSEFGAAGAKKALSFAKKHDNVWSTVGVHPHDAAKVSEDELRAMADVARANRDKVIAWGEIGLDYFYEHSAKDAQIDVFRRQIEIALDLDLPISLHVRDAGLDLMVVLRDEKVRAGDALRGVWHCFTDEADRALEAVDLGFVISIPGIVTFPKGENIREAVAALPLEHLIVETDSPYLAPVPYRGKTNEPAYVVETVKKIAEIKKLSYDEVAAATTANARRAYELDRDRD
ncbi:MAG TPA: TatD family hydrolase [bacterium]|nr:TatD family hydrolase [bacterium]